MLILSQSQSPALSPAQSQAQNYISQQPVWFTPAPCPQSVHLLLIPPRYIDCHQSHHNCLVSLQFLQSSNLALFNFQFTYLPIEGYIVYGWWGLISSGVLVNINLSTHLKYLLGFPYLPFCHRQFICPYILIPARGKETYYHEISNLNSLWNLDTYLSCCLEFPIGSFRSTILLKQRLFKRFIEMFFFSEVDQNKHGRHVTCSDGNIW